MSQSITIKTVEALPVASIYEATYNGKTVTVTASNEMEAQAKAHDELKQGNGFLDLSAIETMVVS